MNANVYSRQIPLKCKTIALEELGLLFVKLRERVEEAGEIELRGHLANPNLPQSISREGLSQFIRDCYKISIIVIGQDGEKLGSYDESILSSSDLPKTISQIYLDSKAEYQSRRTGYLPSNWFTLLLDFSKPPLMDWSNPISGPTPNSSNLTVQGNNEGWVASLQQTVDNFMRVRENNRAAIHKPFAYDFCVATLGIPITFFVLYETSNILPILLPLDVPILEIAIYVYLFFLVLWLFKILFGYMRWAFPTLELVGDHSKASKHRRFWWAVMVGVVGSLIASAVY